MNNTLGARPSIRLLPIGVAQNSGSSMKDLLSFGSESHEEKPRGRKTVPTQNKENDRF